MNRGDRYLTWALLALIHERSYDEWYMKGLWLIMTAGWAFLSIRHYGEKQ